MDSWFIQYHSELGGMHILCHSFVDIIVFFIFTLDFCNVIYHMLLTEMTCQHKF
jgi:hypothetical protein